MRTEDARCRREVRGKCVEKVGVGDTARERLANSRGLLAPHSVQQFCTLPVSAGVWFPFSTSGAALMPRTVQICGLNTLVSPPALPE